MNTTGPDTFYGYFINEAYADVYDTDIVYFITWSPDPARYPSSTPSDQYKVLLDLVLLKSDKLFNSFAFTPELTENGNIHIHGFFTIRDKVKYYKWFLPKIKSFGNTKIERMRKAYWRKALDYLMKDCEIMNQIMDNKLPIPLTHINMPLYKNLFRLTRKKLRLYPHGKAYAKRCYVPRKMDISKLFQDQEDMIVSDNE